MATFEQGTWVWAPDEEDIFMPARVLSTFRAGEATKVQLEDGEEVILDEKATATILELDPQSLESLENMVKLNSLNEASILHNLRLRFKKDQIYTAVGAILVSVNPFKQLPIYTPEVLDSYKSQGARDLPPHVYGIADNAFRNMLSNEENQSVVISGESGAGKTEATKLILQYIAEVSGKGAAKQSGDGGSLEEQILKANPVMEAFGNAKTTRNNNSSRFGKWIEIQFNRSGSIIGGGIVNYLLEKSRVVYQAEGERNYHCFYMLIAGGLKDQTLWNSLKLKEPEQFHYLNQSGVTTVDTINDEGEWEDMRHAMDVLNMSEEEKSAVFRLTAAVLHIGNVEFAVDTSTADDGAMIANPEVMDTIADFLSVNRDNLSQTLVSRSLGAGSVVWVSYKPDQAANARDALSKGLYGRMFDWLIKKINVALSSGIGGGAAADGGETKGEGGVANVIGVLDIFGFESFETNSFEQLCINFCNEKLQFHFNDHIFRLEQEEYAAQGVGVDAIQFSDNQGCLDLLQAKRTGIFSMIDEEINVPRGSDEGFLKKVLKNHMGNDYFIRPKPRQKDSRLVFIVRHYAGPVAYNTTNFLEKNKDSLHADIQGVLKHSGDEFIKGLFAPPPEAAAAAAAAPAPGRRRGGRGGRKKQKTLGAQFKEQLAKLMTTLNNTSPHFVRCMKPNAAKVGDVFESTMMMGQLRYAGLLEVCRIRQVGFPLRKDFDSFFSRYLCIAPQSTDFNSLVENLTASGVLEAGQFAMGSSKLFLRNSSSNALELQREGALHHVTVRIQQNVRMFLAQAAFRRYATILEGLREATTARDERMLEHWVRESSELPFHGSHLSAVSDARALITRLQEEKAVCALLEAALAGRELNALGSAVASATAMGLDTPLLEQAEDLITRLTKEKELKESLTAAIAARDLALLCSLLEEAEALSLDSDEVGQACALRQRLEEEESIVEELCLAMESRNLNEISAFMARMAEMGLDRPELAKARELKAELEAEVAARNALKAAVASATIPTLTAALARASALGFTDESSPEMAEASQLLATLQAKVDAEAAVAAAADAADLGRLREALAAAEELGLAGSDTVARGAALAARLEAEEAARAALVAAVAEGSGDALQAALNGASEVGLSGAEVDAARELLNKLGAQSEASQQLSAAAAAKDVAALEAAIAEAEANDVAAGDIASARTVLSRLRQEEAAAAALSAAVESGDAAALGAALAEASSVGVGAEHAALVAAAQQKLDGLVAADKALAALQSALTGKDSELIQSALDEVRQLAVPDSEALQAEAEAALAAIARDAQLQQQLTDAIASEDEDALRAALAAAAEAGMENDSVRQARILVDRQAVVADITAALLAATASGDGEALNDALERSIELGMTGEAVDAAKAAQSRLARAAEQASLLSAVVDALSVKAASAAGLAAEDVEPVKEALANAAAAAAAETEAEGEGAGEGVVAAAVAAAERAVEDAQAQLQLQTDLEAALDSGEFKALKIVVDKAEDMDLEVDLVKAARRAMREIQMERQRQAAKGEDVAPLVEEDELDAATAGGAGGEGDGEGEEKEEGYDEEAAEAAAEAKRQEKLDKARQPKYHFSKYGTIRSVEDFVKGSWFSKKKVAAGMMVFQSSVIPKSLLLLGKGLSKTATRIHKALLGYCGDKSMSFPAMLAQDILRKGLETPELVDEIYIQICKQLSGNPNAESVSRCWQLMCMCVGTFPPSADFTNYLLNFVLAQQHAPGLIGDYARYSLRRLEGMLASGASGFVPSVEEIQAYKERPPILATIELVDGTPLTEDLPITPDLDCAKVVEICCHFLDLADPRCKFLGVYVMDEGEDEEGEGATGGGEEDNQIINDLPRTPAPLRGEDFLADVVVQKRRKGRLCKFVFKRKIFLGEEEESENRMFQRLLYLQATDEVINGNIPLEEEEAVCTLIATAVAVDSIDEEDEVVFPSDAAELLEAELMEYVPVPWREDMAEEEWAEKVLAAYAPLKDQDIDMLQDSYLALARENVFYGTDFFYTRKATVAEEGTFVGDLPADLVLAFNSSGMHFLRAEDRSSLQSFGFADIYRWGGSMTLFSLIIWDEVSQDTFELSLYTAQAHDMGALILDYINAIMAAGAVGN